MSKSYVHIRLHSHYSVQVVCRDYIADACMSVLASCNRLCDIIANGVMLAASTHASHEITNPRKYLAALFNRQRNAAWWKPRGTVVEWPYCVRALQVLRKKNKYFELKNSWGYRPNSNYLLSSVTVNTAHVSAVAHTQILTDITHTSYTQTHTHTPWTR